MGGVKRVLAALLLSGSAHVMAQVAYIAPPMVPVPAGQFTMGANSTGDYKVQHSPAHVVNVKAFQLGRYEVTVGEFRKFVEDTQHQAKSECWSRKPGTADIEMVPGHWNSARNAPSEFHPVLCIGPDDAAAYLAWLSKKTGARYRLPTEAEWEYAARAGSSGDYFSGIAQKELCQYGNVFDKAGARAFKRDLARDQAGIDCNDHAEYTAIVGMYKPNAFGLFDMIGNVGEFVEDCEHYDYKGAPTDGSAWTSGCLVKTYAFGLVRFQEKIVHRGGNYGDADVRVYVRGHTGRMNASSLGEGFRVALDINVRPVPPEQAASTQAFLTALAAAQAKEQKRRNDAPESR